MAFKFPIAVAALLLPSFTASSSGASSDTIGDAERLLFGTIPASPPLRIPRGSGKANLCATSDAARRLYPGTGIHAVTRDVPFMPYPELNGGVCSIYSHAVPVRRPAARQMTFGTCSVAFRDEGGRQVIDIAPRSPAGGEPFVLSECFYRVALYIQGYRGALQVPTKRLFTNTGQGFWAGQVRFVGPLATLIPTRLSKLCPDLAALYYRSDFAEQAKRRCIGQ